MTRGEFRVPVGVTLNVDRTGNVKPTSIIYDKNRTYRVLNVLSRLRAQDPETGEVGWCYTVQILKPPLNMDTTQRRLYRFGPKWYVYHQGRYDLPAA